MSPITAAASVAHFSSLNTATIAACLAYSVLLGGLIGLERELSGQPAGLRTHISVAVGAALFGLLSTGGFDSYLTSRNATDVQIDVTRIASQVVVGVGFLGAGAIVKDGRRVRGLTTAASLWVTAAIGLAAGLRSWAPAGICTGLLMISLVGLRAPREWLRDRRRARREAARGAAGARSTGRSRPPATARRSPAGPGWKDDRTPVALGIDIGCSGIKGAPVDLATGRMMAERLRLPTPATPRPDAVVAAVAQIVDHFAWKGPLGCTLPATVVGGRLVTARNLSDEWLGEDPAALFAGATQRPVRVLNDADAAGLAEMAFGAGVGREGAVLVVTLGTGIGTALFEGRRLVPNTELAEMRVEGQAAQDRASNRARKELGLSWDEWAVGVGELLRRLEDMVSPELIIVGGGVSKHHRSFLPLLRTTAEVVPAELRNDAGIVGAAMATTAPDSRHLLTLVDDITSA